MDSEIIKQVAEVAAKATGAAAGLSIPFTGIVKRMLGPAADELAEMWRDQVRLYRYERQLKCVQKAERMAEEAGFIPKAVPPKILFPLLDGVSFEDDESLHDMWAALLANAASPEDAEIVTARIVSILKEISLDGAAVLRWMVSRQEHHHYESRIDLKEMTLAYNDLQLGPVDLDVVLGPRPVSPEVAAKSKIDKFGRCINSLQSQGLAKVISKVALPGHTDYEYDLTWLGISFIRACQPPKPKDKG